MSKEVIYYISHRLKLISYTFIFGSMFVLFFLWVAGSDQIPFLVREIRVFGKSVSAFDCMAVIMFFGILLAVFAIDDWRIRWNQEKEEFYKYADKIKSCLDNILAYSRHPTNVEPSEFPPQNVAVDLAAMFDIFSPPLSDLYSADLQKRSEAIREWRVYLTLMYARAKRKRLWKARRESRRFAPEEMKREKGWTWQSQSMKKN